MICADCQKQKELHQYGMCKECYETIKRTVIPADELDRIIEQLMEEWQTIQLQTC